MADIKITDLTAAQAATADDLFEIAQPSGNDFVSLKLTAAQLATLIAAVQTYSGLTTTDKTVVGAINEVDGDSGKVDMTATPSGAATTYSYPVLFADTGVTPGSDPATRFEAARISGGIFFQPNYGALYVRRIHSDTTIQTSTIAAGNTIADGTAGSCYGVLQLYGKGQYYFQIRDSNNVLSNNRTYYAQDVSGTLAMLENIYTIAGRAGTVASGANLNSAAYTAPGRYYCNATNAATLSNSPITDTAFIMDVINVTGSGMGTVTDAASSYRKRIIYTAYSSDVRRYEQTCWSNSSSVASYGSWVKYILASDVTSVSDSGSITTETNLSDTRKSLTLPTAGWWAIEGFAMYANSAPAAIGIVREVGSYYYELAYAERHGGFDKTVQYLRTSCVGYYDASSVIKLFARYEAAGSNTVGLSAHKLV